MTNEEIAEKYADKMLSDPTYPFIFSKEEVKACIIKVYLDSLKCCENIYNKGLAEGEIIGKEKQWIATGKAQKKTSAKIKELEKDKEYLDKVNNEQTEVILKLNEQIEKMKNFYNCSHSSRALCPNEHKCNGCKDWGLAE